MNAALPIADRTEPPRILRISFDLSDISDILSTVPALRALLNTWTEAYEARGRILPARREIDITHLRDALPYLCLLDVIDEGMDFRYRVYGTQVASAYGRDMTGLCVSELIAGADQFFLDRYRAVVEHAMPIYCRSTAQTKVAVEYWDRLFVPLAANGRTVDKVLTAAVPRAFRRQPERYL